jgi:hypothetical protein
MRRLRRHATPATVIATLALFVALGGTAVAAFVVSSNSQVAPGVIYGAGGGSAVNHNIAAQSVTSKDLQDHTVSATDVVRPPWHEVGQPGQPAFLNGWTNDVAPNETAGFVMDASGFVHLKGYVCGGDCSFPSSLDADSAIFQLPPAFRPSHYQHDIGSSFDNSGNPVPVPILISPDGFVYARKGANPIDVGIDGITFRVGD